MDRSENLGWGTGRTHIIREKDWGQLNQWNGYKMSGKRKDEAGKTFLWIAGISLVILLLAM